MKIPHALGLAAACLALFSPSSNAEGHRLSETTRKVEADSGGFYSRLQPYVLLEHFFGDNPYSDIEHRISDARGAYESFYGNYDFTFDSKQGGNGVRLGVLYSNFLGSSLDWGGNVSYVAAPGDHSSITFGNYREQLDIRLRYIQCMLEGSRSFDVFSNTHLKIGVGGGIGQGKVNFDDNVDKIDTGVRFDTFSGSDDWWGFTYDVQTSLGWNVNRFLIETGIRYTQFPKRQAELHLAEINWTPLSVFASLSF